MEWDCLVVMEHCKEAKHFVDHAYIQNRYSCQQYTKYHRRNGKL